MFTLPVIAIIPYVLLFIIFAWAMKEVHFIHKVKKCKHICFLCPYAVFCHDGYIKSNTYIDEYEPLIEEHRKKHK